MISEILSSPSYGNLEADANLAGGKWGGGSCSVPVSKFPAYLSPVGNPGFCFFFFILVFVIFLNSYSAMQMLCKFSVEEITTAKKKMSLHKSHFFFLPVFSVFISERVLITSRPLSYLTDNGFLSPSDLPSEF